MSIICKNATVEEEAILLGMNIVAQGNFTMKDFVFFPKVDNMLVHNTKVKRAHVKIPAEDLNKVVKKTLQGQVDAFNEKFVKGWSIAEIDPQLAMITGLIKNSTMTPYLKDNWLYGGFVMQADLPTETHKLEFIQ